MAEQEGADGVVGWHRVCLNTIVRKEKELDSERLRILPMGSRVNVVQRIGRRVRIDQPIVGWCSLQSSNGDTILKPLDPNQKNNVAATPRSGQAAVTNLESKVKATDQQIADAKQAGEKQKLADLTAEKEQLQARISDLVQANQHQQKVFEDFKKAADMQAATSTDETGTVPTDMARIQFRNGDAVIVNKKKCGLEGIVVVRCVANIEGKEKIGCDYDYQGIYADFAKANPDYATDGAGKFTPSDGMVGVWLERTDLKSLLPTVALLQKMEETEQENTDLKFYERTAKGMIKIVKQYKMMFEQNMESITFQEKGQAKTIEGTVFAAQFQKAFLKVDIQD